MTDMNKLVWMDYWKALKWKTAWSRMLELTGFGVVIVQMIIMYPFNLFDLEGRAVVYYYFVVTPMIFSMFSALCVELHLPKQMYLTPLTQVERREYMEKLLRLKIVFPNVIMALVIVVMLIFGEVHISMGFILLVQNVFTTMGLGLFYKKKAPYDRKQIHAEGSMFWAGCVMLIGLIGEMFIIGGFCRNEMVDKTVIILFGISAIVQLFCLYKMYTRKNQYFDNLSNYEKLHVVEEKKEVKTAW